MADLVPTTRVRPLRVSEHPWPSLLGGGMDVSWKWAAENGLFFPTCLESTYANPCPQSDNIAAYN